MGKKDISMFAYTYIKYFHNLKLVAASEEGKWLAGISRCKLLYIGWINNKVLLYSIGDSIQCTVINHRGKEYEKECIYVYN